MAEASGLKDTGETSRAGRGFLALVAALLATFALQGPATASPDADSPKLNENCPVSAAMLNGDARLAAFADRISERAALRVLAIGSSSTQGVGATAPGNAYPARLEDGLKQQFGSNVEVTNAGVGGETAETTLARLEERVTAEKFDLVVWQVGTNDAVKGADENAFRDLLERGVKIVKAKQTELVLLDQQFFPTIKDPVRYERFVKTIEVIGDETDTPVLSRYRLMKTWGERAPQDLRTMLAADGFHMSDRGYLCLARAMVTAVSDLVTGKTAPQGLSPAMAGGPRISPRP